MQYNSVPELKKLVSLFSEKNQHINLSAIRDEKSIWEKHIQDSLITLPLFEQF